mgnify:FL=1|jgi:hypothetical protein
MKKFLVLMIAVFAATSAFAADPIFGAKPPVKKSGVGFTSQSVGVQMQDNKFFVNYANDGKDWFTITNPGKDVPNVENYAGGLFKGTRFVSVVATNGVETRVSFGLEKQLVKFDVPVIGTNATVMGQVFPTGFGGGSFSNLNLSNNWAWGVRVGFDVSKLKLPKLF